LGMAVHNQIAMWAAIGIGAFVLTILFGAINYVKTEMTNSGVNFTAPATLENAVNTAGNLSGVGLILLAITTIIGVVSAMMYLFNRS